MTPREAKPPAIPVPLAETERQLDQLLSAIDEHQWQGHEIGRMNQEGRLNRKQTIELAERRDIKLYARRDSISAQIEETRTEQIEEENRNES